MPELLYKLLRKPSANVAVANSMYDLIESKRPDFSIPIVPYLVSDDFEIGLEVEMEKVRGADNVVEYPVWYTHADGSLRNGGLEFVTVPIKGKRITFAINWLFGTLTGYHFSPRTSIHVHLNVLDLTPQQVAGLLVTYMAFEKLFYRYVGGARDKNNFCVPVLDTGVTVLNYFQKDTLALPNLQNHRYMGVNIGAISKFGSLEFRHLGGTSDKVKIMRWINLIFCLKRFAKNKPFAEIKATVDKLNTNSSYKDFFNQVFGEWGLWLDSSSLQRDMESGVSLIKRLTVENSWKQEIVDNFSKKDHWCVVLKETSETVKEYVWPAKAPTQPRQRGRDRERLVAGRVNFGIIDAAPEPVRYEAPMFFDDVEAALPPAQPGEIDINRYIAELRRNR